MRLLSTATTRSRDKVYYKNEAFTGILYELAKDGVSVLPEKSVVAGMVLGDVGIRDANIPRIVLSDAATVGPTEVRRQGKLFTGIGLEFLDEGSLATETEFVEGTPTNTFNAWFETGMLESYQRDGQDGKEGKSWYESGAIESIFRPGLVATFKESGELTSLDLAGSDAYLDIRFPLRIYSQLRLDGPGITDQIVAMLTSVDQARSLSIRGTCISGAGLNAFSGLTELTTRNNKQLSKIAIQEFRASQPGLEWVDLDVYGNAE